MLKNSIYLFFSLTLIKCNLDNKMINVRKHKRIDILYVALYLVDKFCLHTENRAENEMKTTSCKTINTAVL